MKLFIGSKFTEHDSAAYIINPSEQDVFAMSTERITRFKHDYLYPTFVIKKYLERKKINPENITEIYLGLPFNSNGTVKISPQLNEKETLLRKVFQLKYIKDVQDFKKSFHPLKYIFALAHKDGWRLLLTRLHKNMKIYKLRTVEEESKNVLQSIFPNATIHTSTYDHAFCHAVSSYYSSEFKDATLITMDGYGDGVFSRAYLCENGKFTEIATSKYQSINLGNISIGSIGEIYSYFTKLLGFQPQADEGKVEALAAYGDHQNELYTKLMDLITFNPETLSIEIDIDKGYNFLRIENIQSYINRMSKEDISASVQQFLEDSTIPYYKAVLEKTGVSNLCMSGGVAANVIMNLNIFENVTENLHIIPAMGDEGTSEGAAILMMLNNGYTQEEIQWLKATKMPYLGSAYTNDEIKDTLIDAKGIQYEYIEENWPKKIALLLEQKKIGALFQGRAEWGPRALGNRSIIAITNDKDIRTKINKEIKKRPLFQPFCPSILIEEKERLFEKTYNNKHMTCAFRLKSEFNDAIPSSIHIDGTARVQFVSYEDNPNYYLLLSEIKKITGFGVLINTSFNKHGRTIVETPQDAVDDFLDTDLHFMMIGNYLVTRQ
jgi:carbamoyltransferase